MALDDARLRLRAVLFASSFSPRLARLRRLSRLRRHGFGLLGLLCFEPILLLPCTRFGLRLLLPLRLLLGLLPAGLPVCG